MNLLSLGSKVFVATIGIAALVAHPVQAGELPVSELKVALAQNTYQQPGGFYLSLGFVSQVAPQELQEAKWRATCQVGDKAVVALEKIGRTFSRAKERFVSPFIFARLAQAPSRCELAFLPQKGDPVPHCVELSAPAAKVDSAFAGVAGSAYLPLTPGGCAVAVKGAAPAEVIVLEAVTAMVTDPSSRKPGKSVRLQYLETHGVPVDANNALSASLTCNSGEKEHRDQAKMYWRIPELPSLEPGQSRVMTREFFANSPLPVAPSGCKLTVTTPLVAERHFCFEGQALQQVACPGAASSATSPPAPAPLPAAGLRPSAPQKATIAPKRVGR